MIVPHMCRFDLSVAESAAAVSAIAVAQQSDSAIAVEQLSDLISLEENCTERSTLAASIGKKRPPVNGNPPSRQLSGPNLGCLSSRIASCWEEVGGRAGPKKPSVKSSPLRPCSCVAPRC